MWLVRVSLVIVSALVSIGVLVVGLEAFLRYKNLPQGNPYSSWTIQSASYTPDYIYWVTRSEVAQAERGLVNDPETYCLAGYEKEEQPLRVLFLGDSHTVAFSGTSYESYASVFARELVKARRQCVVVMRLATGGVGPSQELAMLEDTIDGLKPDILIWQFFSNDVYNNIQLSVHEVKDGNLLRIKPWRNFFFWAGFVQQKLSFLSRWRVGKALLILSERRDPFSAWPVDPANWDGVARYNEKFLPLLIDSMERLSQREGFTLFTFLVPHECEVRAAVLCPSGTHVDNAQNVLRSVIDESTQHLRVDFSEESLSATSEQLFFSHEPVTENGRHLSVKGNQVLGEQLFQSFAVLSENLADI